MKKENNSSAGSNGTESPRNVTVLGRCEGGAERCPSRASFLGETRETSDLPALFFLRFQNEQVALLRVIRIEWKGPHSMGADRKTQGEPKETDRFGEGKRRRRRAENLRNNHGKLGNRRT